MTCCNYEEPRVECYHDQSTTVNHADVEDYIVSRHNERDEVADCEWLAPEEKYDASDSCEQPRDENKTCGAG